MDITSRKNEKVTHLKKLGSSGAYRRECGEFVCDGFKLLAEAVKWGAEIKTVMYCGERPALDFGDARVFSVTREVLEAASPMKTPQNVVFTVSMPDRLEPEDIDGCVILENIQDPGNVGTMLRTANAFSIRGVILTGDCADPWGPKAVRAGMGAIFRQRIYWAPLSFLHDRAAKGERIIGAALTEDAKDIRKIALTGAAVAIGNEGSGLSRELLDICSEHAIIPMDEQCESLNAAAAASVIMWEMSRGIL